MESNLKTSASWIFKNWFIAVQSNSDVTRFDLFEAVFIRLFGVPLRDLSFSTVCNDRLNEPLC